MKKRKYAIALAFTSLIFSIGVLLGTQLISSHTINIQRSIEKDLLEMQSLELELSMVAKSNATSICGYIDYRLPDIIKKKVELGRKFDIGDIPAEEASILKKQYIISITKYWLFSEVNKQCTKDKPNVLFFFDNSEESREQGRVLDYLVYRSNESITVFSFNTQWDEPLIRLFTVNYNATRMPTIVLDGKAYTGLQNAEALEKIFCSGYNLSFC